MASSPAGVPVATVALNGAKNAGILAIQILGSHNENIANRLDVYKDNLCRKVEDSVLTLEKKGWKETQVVVRFWIITMLLCLVGLSTLKLR